MLENYGVQINDFIEIVQFSLNKVVEQYTVFVVCHSGIFFQPKVEKHYFQSTSYTYPPAKVPEQSTSSQVPPFYSANQIVTQVYYCATSIPKVIQICWEFFYVFRVG